MSIILFILFLGLISLAHSTERHGLMMTLDLEGESAGNAFEYQAFAEISFASLLESRGGRGSVSLFCVR